MFHRSLPLMLLLFVVAFGISPQATEAQIRIPLPGGSFGSGGGSFSGRTISGVVRQTVQQAVQPGPVYRTLPVQNTPVYRTQPRRTTTCPTPVYPQPVVGGGQVVTRPANPVVKKPAQPAPKTDLSKMTALEQARYFTQQAKTAFEAGNYSESVRFLDHVVKRVPENTDAYQFRSIAHFANEDFKAAAADAYDAMNKGANTWTLEIVQSLYRENQDYQKQLEKLQTETRKQNLMTHHFLLAYHHLVQGNLESGKVHLQTVLTLQPGEPLSEKLLAAIHSRLASDQTAPTPTSTPGG